MADEKLKACPFPHLGKELLHGEFKAKGQYWIHCPCGAMGPICDSPEKAIAAWNRRTPGVGLSATDAVTLRTCIDILSEHGYRGMAAKIIDIRDRLTNAKEGQP